MTTTAAARADRAAPMRPGLALAVAALLIGAAALITHPAARHSIWYDEAWSVLAIRGHDAASIIETVRADFHTPVYFLALSAWASLTGFSEPALRYSSVLCAALTAALVYRLAVDLYRSRAAGAMAALALCTMPLHIRFAQEVRMYAALAALVVASMLLFWRFLVHPRRATALAYVLVTALAIYVQYLALFLILIHLLVSVGWVWVNDYTKRKAGRWAVLLPLFAALLFLPWFPTFAAQLTSAEYVPIHSHALPSTPDTILSAIGEDFFAGQAILYLLLIGVAALGVARAPARWDIRLVAPRATGFLAAWGVGWLAQMWATNLVVPHYQARNALAALPALAILVGWGLSRWPRPAAIVLLALLMIGNLTGYYAFQAKDLHYRDAVAELARGYHPGDLIFVQVNTFLHDLPLQHYLDYLLPPHPEPGWFSTLAGGWSPGSEAFAQAFAEAVDNRPRFWLLQTLPVDNRWLATAVPHTEVSNVHVDAFQIALYESPR